MTTADWLALAAEAYRTSTTYMDAYLRPEWERALRQWQGKHPQDSKYLTDAWSKRSNVFRPKTRAATRKNEATAAKAFFSTQDVLSIQAVDDADEMNRLGAEIMQGIVQFRLTRTIPWFLILLAAYQETQKTGICLSHQYWEYDDERDQPVIELIPPENLRIDPAAGWLDPINSSPYLIHLLPMYLGDVQERMRRIDPKTGEPPWLYVDAKDLLAASANVNDSTRLAREGNRADPTTQANANDRFTIVWIRKHIVRVEGVDWLYYTAGGEHLLSKPTPLANVVHTGKRPYALGFCVLEAFKAIPSGVVEMTKDIQSEINEIGNQRLDNVKFVLNKRYFAKRGAQVDMRSLTRNVPGSVTLMNDPEHDVVEKPTPDVTASSFQEHDRLNLDFDDLAGNFSQATVQANRRLNETVGGMNLLSDGANVVSEYQLRLFTETWVEPVLRQLVALEQMYETDPVVLRFAGQNSALFQQYRLDGVPDALLGVDLKVTCNVGIGATNPQTQVERFFYGLQSLANVIGPEQFAQKLKFEEVSKEAFGKLGYKDGQRFFNLDGEDPRIAQLMQQIQALQEELQRKRSPELEAAQIEKLKAESVKVGVETAQAAMQAGQIIAAIPQVAVVGDEILASSGFIDRNGPPVATPPTGPAPRRESYIDYQRREPNPVMPETVQPQPMTPPAQAEPMTESLPLAETT